jgi:hypothetical protein
MLEVHAALHDIEQAGISSEQVAFVFQRDRPLPARIGDGKKGLLIGIVSGPAVAALTSFLLARLGILPAFFSHTALFALLGLIVGGLGGGLYGMGLFAKRRKAARPPLGDGDCLITASAADAEILGQVDTIFRRHHGLAAAAT